MLELTANLICFGLFIYKWLIILAVLISWVNADPYNPIVQWIARFTRPLWVWCEQRMPVMMAHFSPYASLLLIIFAQAVIPAEIRSLDYMLKYNEGLVVFFYQSGGNLIQGISIVMQSLIFFFIIILLLWFFLTLINPALNNPIVRIIHVLADPIITPIQSYLPRSRIDFSPLISLIFFLMINAFLVIPLQRIGSNLSNPIPICSF